MTRRDDDPRRDRREPAPPGRDPQGQGRLRLLVGPVGRRDAVGLHPAQPAPARPHPRDQHRARARRPRRARRPHARGRARPQGLRPRDRRPAGAGLRPGPLPGRGGGDRRRRPPRDRAPRRLEDRGRLRGARRRSPTPRRRSTPSRCTRPATCCATSTSSTATRRRPPRSWSPASTRSACRTRPSWGRSRASRCRPRTAASTSSSSTQWLHVDRDQTAASLDLPPEKVRITLGGVGGAFGGREDLSMQIHACMLALHTGKPVKMMYGREESFFGHIHRHPARMRYEHGATRDGDLVYVKCRILLDGGAYASSRTAVCSNAACFAAGPVRGPERADRLLRRLHRQPAVRRDARLRRRADLLRPRGADGQAGRRAGAWTRSSCGAATRCPRAPSSPPARRSARPRPVAALLDSVASRPLPGPSRDHARRPLQHHPRRGRAARDRLRGRLQERRLLGGLRRLLDRARAALARGRRAAGRGPHRGRRGRPGAGHRAGADRAPRARRRARDRAARRHAGRLGRLLVGLAPDLHDRRRGQARLRGGARGARAARRRRSTSRSTSRASTTTGRRSRSTRRARATRT